MIALRVPSPPQPKMAAAPASWAAAAAAAATEGSLAAITWDGRPNSAAVSAQRRACIARSRAPRVLGLRMKTMESGGMPDAKSPLVMMRSVRARPR